MKAVPRGTRLDNIGKPPLGGWDSLDLFSYCFCQTGVRGLGGNDLFAEDGPLPVVG